eukprot:COSAG06_NODE_31_length_31488_cov_60.882793_13_plen_44_part_00
MYEVNIRAIDIYYIKTIILPRQARDKHRENSQIYRACRLLRIA